ncbi:hypothetical protein Q5752_004306 [Cryptotrichosporon argae]
MRSPSSGLPGLALGIALAITLAPLVAAFDFALSSSSLAQCAAVNITWTGGTAPFFLTVIPAFDYPTNISIPDSAYSVSTGAGSYAWTVDYPGDTNVVFAMSDATGFAAGGVSDVYKVSNSSASCSMRSTTTNWEFYLNETSVTQCQPVEVYWDTTAVAPVTIIGVIPHGQAFVLEGQSSSSSLVWDVNVASGTSFILSAWDSGSSSSTGGSSNLLVVGSGSSSSCVNANSPSSTAAASATSTQAAGASSTTKKTGGVVTVTAIATAVAGGAGLSTGAIIGVVVGVVVVVVALQAALIWFCCRRQVATFLADRRRRRSRDADSALDKRNELDLVSSRGTGAGAGGGRAVYALAPSTSRASLSHSITSAPEESSTISPFLDPETMRRNSDFGSPLMGPGHWDGYGSGQDTLPTPGGNTPTPAPGPSRPPPANPSKRALLAANPDDGVLPYFAGDHATSTWSSSASDPHLRGAAPATHADDADLGTRLPPLEAPRGGFRRHEDAGPVARPRAPADAEPEVEDLPPNYDPEWERHRPQ